MKEYFECHITIDPTPQPGATADEHQAFVEAVLAQGQWIFSHIHHDIVLGVGPKFYATKHFNVNKCTVDEVWEVMQGYRADWESRGARVLRCKIERVIRDERYDR